MYFDLILFFDSPIDNTGSITIGNATTMGLENGYSTIFYPPSSCNGVLFRMIRHSASGGVYIDIHPTFLY